MAGEQLVGVEIYRCCLDSRAILDWSVDALRELCPINVATRTSLDFGLMFGDFQFWFGDVEYLAPFDAIGSLFY